MLGDTEGLIPVDGGRVWYRSVGSGGVPLVLLHGGPGAGHDVLEALEALGKSGRVVFYDQLGCGRSDRPEDPSLWRMDRFVSELESLRRTLGLEQMHLLGHSWGGWLALEYALSHSSRVARLVLTGTSASTAELVTEISRLRRTLPRDSWELMERCEAVGDLKNPEYTAALMGFFRQYYCRLDPWPDCLLRSAANMEGNPVYEAMIGASVFTLSGNMQGWDLSDRLSEISMPTLITVGRFDSVSVACAQTFHRGIPNPRLVVFEKSSHMPMLEETDEYLRVVEGFLRQPTPHESQT